MFEYNDLTIDLNVLKTEILRMRDCFDYLNLDQPLVFLMERKKALYLRYTIIASDKTLSMPSLNIEYIKEYEASHNIYIRFGQFDFYGAKFRWLAEKKASGLGFIWI